MNIVLYNFPDYEVYDRINEHKKSDENLLFLHDLSELISTGLKKSDRNILFIYYLQNESIKRLGKIIRLSKLYLPFKVIVLSKRFTKSSIRECFLGGADDCIDMEAHSDYYGLLKDFEGKTGTSDEFFFDHSIDMFEREMLEKEHHSYFLEHGFLEIIKQKSIESTKRLIVDLKVDSFSKYMIVLAKLNYGREMVLEKNYESTLNLDLEMLSKYIDEYRSIYLCKDSVVLSANGDTLICFISLVENEPDNVIYKKITELFDCVYAKYLNHIGVKTIAVMSELKTDILHLSDAYFEAQNAFTTAFYETNGHIFLYSKSDTPVENGNVEKLMLMTDNAVMLGDSYLLSEKIKTVLNSFEEERFTFSQMKMILEKLIYRISFLASRNNFEFKTKVSDKLDILEALSRLNSYSEIKALIAEHISKNFKDKSDDEGGSNPFINASHRYISENFSQPLTLQSVADHIHLNPNYLCELFSKKSGETFYEYLLKVRMLETKRLLLETDMNINKIAPSVGYSEIVSFNRAFKRFYGMSPSQYKQKYLSEKK